MRRRRTEGDSEREGREERGWAWRLYFMCCTSAHTLDFSSFASVLSEGNMDQNRKGERGRRCCEDERTCTGDWFVPVVIVWWAF